MTKTITKISYIANHDSWPTYKMLYEITQQELDAAFDGDRLKWKSHNTKHPGDYLTQTFDEQE